MPGQRAANIIQVNLRITQELHKQLQRSATRAGRSLNQEMMLRLEQSYRGSDPAPLSRAQTKKFIDYMGRAAGEKQWTLLSEPVHGGRLRPGKKERKK
jgi:hypothetical protein